MNALGMIEVYGLLTAVEALDSALKAANVSRISVEKVGGGLVSVFVEGDVGAVKAAMDASSAAAQRVGTVISVHVIPRPASGVEHMLEDDVPEKKGCELGTEPRKEAEQPETEVEHPATEPEQIVKPEELQSMSVEALRRLARELEVDMTRAEIRYAKKRELIQKITEQER